jgi:hypothetical protein
MKKTLYLLLAGFLLSCQPNNPTPPTVPTTNGINGDYQELHYRICTYDGTSGQMTSETQLFPITLSNTPQEFVRLSNGKIVQIIYQVEQQIGVYTNQYITYSADTAYITSVNSEKMIAETVAPPLGQFGSYSTKKYIFTR